MDQAEVSIHKVEVQVQTLPSCGFDKRALIRKWLLEEKRERATGFKDRENAHQAMLDSVALGKLSRRPILVDVGYEVSKRPAMFLGHRYSVMVHALGVFEQEGFQIAEIHIQAIKEPSHRPTRHDGEVAPK
jgi:hypothetical protein